jgi:hypothetical protein
MSASIRPTVARTDSESVAESPSPSNRAALRAALHRDLESARHALGRIRGAFSFAPVTLESHAAARTVPSAPMVALLLHGMARERDVVLGPLLDRLEAFGARLASEQDVPAGPIEEGIALVDEYLAHLHDTDLRLLQAAGSDAATTESARLTLDKLASDFDNSRVRWVTVRVMLRGYELKLGYYRAMIGLTLTQECRAERAWHDFMEAYVRTSVPPTGAGSAPASHDTWRARPGFSRPLPGRRRPAPAEDRAPHRRTRAPPRPVPDPLLRFVPRRGPAVGPAAEPSSNPTALRRDSVTL